jgi:hypothetical protein
MIHLNFESSRTLTRSVIVGWLPALRPSLGLGQRLLRNPYRRSLKLVLFAMLKTELGPS